MEAELVSLPLAVSTEFHTAFPDLQFTIGEPLAEGDRVTFRATLCGIHQGLFPFPQGTAPTGKQATISVPDAVRVEGKNLLNTGEGLICLISSGSWVRCGLRRSTSIQ
jgi:SnoaL-like polyketide cyclase